MYLTRTFALFVSVVVMSACVTALPEDYGMCFKQKNCGGVGILVRPKDPSIVQAGVEECASFIAYNSQKKVCRDACGAKCYYADVQKCANGPWTCVVPANW